MASSKQSIIFLFVLSFSVFEILASDNPEWRRKAFTYLSDNYYTAEQNERVSWLTEEEMKIVVEAVKNRNFDLRKRGIVSPQPSGHQDPM